jgi:hypothetical protein
MLFVEFTKETTFWHLVNVYVEVLTLKICKFN